MNKMTDVQKEEYLLKISELLHYTSVPVEDAIFFLGVSNIDTDEVESELAELWFEKCHSCGDWDELDEQDICRDCAE